jgi:hypothetical protein
MAVLILIVYGFRASFDRAGWHAGWLTVMWITFGAGMIFCYGRNVVAAGARWRARQRQPRRAHTGR